MQIAIDSQSHDGRGVGRVDGKVAFVAGALPGETVDAVLARSHRRFDEYRLREVIVPAPARVEPRCPLVGRCGGCDLQHQPAPAQLEHKTGVVLEQLRRQAGIEPAELVEPLTSVPFGYRRRARLAVSVRRGVPQMGFREARGSDVIGVAACPVLVPPLDALLAPLQTCLAGMHRPADIGHLELSLSESADGTTYPVIHVHVPGSLQPGDREALADLATRSRAYLSIGAPGGRVEQVRRPCAEDPGYRLPDFDLRIGYRPDDFLQGNADVNRLLVGRVVDWLGEPGGRRVLDAFAGVGNFSLALARRGFRVLALEGDAAMVDRGRANARANGLDDVVFERRDLMRAAPLAGLDAVDAAVLDPPRAGALAVVKALVERAVVSIVYVSCAPATFVRDAGVLVEAGYRLQRLALVDMFPQTSHIELLASFEYEGRDGRRPRRAR